MASDSERLREREREREKERERERTTFLMKEAKERGEKTSRDSEKKERSYI